MNQVKTFGQMSVVVGSLLIAVAVGLCSCDGPQNSADKETRSPTALSQPGTVRLTIEFPDSEKNIDSEVDWSDGLTVFELVQRVAEQFRVELKTTGAGETAFVHSIGGIAGGGAGGPNWIYYVNDELAKVGSGAKTLSAGDRVLWKLGEYP